MIAPGVEVGTDIGFGSETFVSRKESGGRSEESRVDEPRDRAAGIEGSVSDADQCGRMKEDTLRRSRYSPTSRGGVWG